MTKYQITSNKQVTNHKLQTPNYLDFDNFLLRFVCALVLARPERSRRVPWGLFRSIRSIRNLPASDGFTLVELLVATATFVAIVVGLISLNSISIRGSAAATVRGEANSVLEATLEQLMAVRASNFSQLTTGTFHPVITAGKWSLASGSDDVGNITRQISVSTVQRELSCGGERICPIVATGGIVDPVTFKATVTVSWTENGHANQESVDTLLSFWR